MTHIDLFSGIGGFSLAARNLDIETIAYSEIDKAAIEAYNLNFPGHEALGDINKLKTIPYADIVTAGVPCQSWSSAGNKRGFDDPRGKLWWDTIRVIKNSQPKAFICENVKGMLHKNNRSSFDYILKKFNDAGYDCFFQLLNSKFFGVPQNRERVFVVGFRKDLNIKNFKFPVGKLTTKVVSDILDTEIEGNFILTEKAIACMNRNYGAISSRWQKGLHHENNKVSRTMVAVLHKGVPYNVVIIYLTPENVPKDFKIVKTVYREDGIVECYSATKEMHLAKVRRYMPRECARLQGYPEDFKLHPVKTHAYKQIGNSITVPVVQKLMEIVQRLIKDAAI